MDARSVPEIKEAVELLEGYERAQLTYDHAKEFARAIEILEDYLDENPDSPYRGFIQNIRLSYTRSMLHRLAEIDPRDAGVSLEHILFVVHTVKAEAEVLMRDFPELKAEFDSLLKVWAEPLAQALAEDAKHNMPHDG